MRRAGLRALMVLVGLAVFAFYLVVAYLSYRLLFALWASRPDWPAALAVVVGLTLALGYLSYRVGTARLVANLHARELSPASAPGLFRRIDRLCERMDVDRPRVLVARLEAPNAVSLGGPRGGTLVLDRSLFDLLDADEFEGVVAHELAHLESYDTLVQTVAYTAVQTVVGLVLFVLLPVILVGVGVDRALAWLRGAPRTFTSPLAKTRGGVGWAVALVLFFLTVLVRAHSRGREFAADERAVEVTGRPVALARALRKIERASEPPWGLLSPLYVHGDEEGTLSRMLSTHPPMDERVERLVAAARRRERRR